MGMDISEGEGVNHCKV